MSVVVTRLRRIDYYIVHIEGDKSGNISVDVRKEVEEHIRESWLFFNKNVKTSFSIKDLCCETMRLFSWIKNIEVRRIPYNSGAYISIILHKLLYIVNEKYVVTSSGDLLPKNIFKQCVLNKLEHVQVFFEDNNSIQLSEACKRFIFLLPTAIPALLSDYICVWENQNRVWFCDKSKVNYAILAHPSRLPTQNELSSVSFLKEELAKREKLGKRGVFGQKRLDDLKQQKTWVADIRFKDQIIVSQNKWGPRDSGVNKWGEVWDEYSMIG